MTDPITLASISATVLTEGIKFLFNQTGELIKKWNEKRTSPATSEQLQLKLPAELGGKSLVVALDHALLEQAVPELQSLRQALFGYVDGMKTVSTSDEALRTYVESTRRILEVLYGQELTFAGEAPRSTGPRINARVQLQTVLGYAAAVRAGNVRAGQIDATATATSVEATGQLVTFDVKNIG